MSQDSNSSFNNNDVKKYDKLAGITLIVGIGLLLIVPWLLTLNGQWSILDFTKTGQIGDTIGGTTAPFMSLVGSVLVYLSFRMQTKMNQIQFEAIKKQFDRNNDEDREKNFGKLLDMVDWIRKDYGEHYKNLFGTNVASFKYVLTDLENNIQYYPNRVGGNLKLLNTKTHFLNPLIKLKERIEATELHIDDQELLVFMIHIFFMEIHAYDGQNTTYSYIKSVRKLNYQSNQNINLSVLEQLEAKLEILNYYRQYN